MLHDVNFEKLKNTNVRKKFIPLRFKNKNGKEMKHFFITIFFLCVFMIIAPACSSSRKAQQSIPRDMGIIVPDTFVLPEMPELLTNPAERAEFLVMNYWRRFDFANEKLIDRPEITEQAFVDYINILGYVPEDLAKKSISHTLNKARVSKKMYTHFVSLFEKYYYDIESPFHNESLYVHILQEILRSRTLSEAEKSPYRFQLEMAQKNSVGSRTADFHYTSATGETNTLYALRSEYTLLIFSDPVCTTCAAAIEQLNNCEKVNAALARNSSTRTLLTILTIYPNNNIDEWRANISTKPANWTHAFNPNMEIARRRLYDIRTFPTIYLLDRDKRVILKNASVEAVEAFFSTH
jgi:hypothetical protein